MKFNDFVKDGKPTPQDEFIGLLMASQAYFHSAHFETKSYARHKAYNVFFDEIPDLIDAFGEQWLGFSGKSYTPALPSQSELPKDTIEMLDLIVAKADGIYKSLPAALQSTMDDITGLCFKTKYLLSLQ
ncbi:hypothetical protein CPT_Metamorpho_191 [Klebsiella phage Metamorpho]|nr:hypothetical protein CPT_Metamorpho_191 [Klebsiella phage Metamorpho]